METIINNQEEMNRAVVVIPMIGNIYYDEEMNYVPIDWDKECVKIIKDNNTTTVKRLLI